jgi:branched-chain amino acid transport system substrate-binding protein
MATGDYSLPQVLKRRDCLLGAATWLANYHPAAWAQLDKGTAIKLGQSAPLTGPQSKSAIAFRDAARAMFADAGPIGSGAHRIELVTLDDAGKSERTATNIKLLATEHRVLALYGFMGPGAHRIGALGAQQEGLAYIAPVTGAPELRTGQMPWVFNMRASNKDELQFVARHAQQVGQTRIALVHEYNPQGWELRDTLSALGKSLRIETVRSASVDQEGSEFSVKQAVSTVMAAQPQCMILGADYAASAKFVEAARQAGYLGLFYALSTVGGAALIEQLGQRAVGMSVTQVVPFPWTDATPVSTAYQQFCKRHQLAPGFEGMEAWLSAQLTIDALRKIKQFTPEKIRESLDAGVTRDFGGYAAVLTAKPAAQAHFVDLTVFSRDGRFRK